MTAAAHSGRQSVRPILQLFAALLLFAPVLGAAQETLSFDELAAADEIRDINEKLDVETIDEGFLTSARSRAVKLEAEAVACAELNSQELTRLELRFAPLKDIDPEVAGFAVMDQRQGIRAALDEAIAAQSRCKGVEDAAHALSARITDIQSKLSAQFLSNRTQSIVTLVREFPERAATWPTQIGQSLSLALKDDVTPTQLLWLLVVAGGLAAFFGPVYSIPI